jgi:hypothetical protein
MLTVSTVFFSHARSTVVVAFPALRVAVASKLLVMYSNFAWQPYFALLLVTLFLK